MTNDKKISVLTTLINKENPIYLDQCLESIFKQTLTPEEIILVQEGELLDSHYSILDKWSVLHSEKIKIIKVPQFTGFPESLNVGIKNCKSEFIARMDTDDICHVERFEKQLNFLLFNTNIDCVGSWAIEIDENGKELFLKKMPLTNESCYQFFRKRDCFVHSSVMFRNTYFQKAGLYPNTKYDEDTQMWANGFINNCKFANIAESLLYFRINTDFYQRRRGWLKAISILKMRLRIAKDLQYGFNGYFYAFAFFIIRLLPPRFLRIAYKNLRKKD